MTSPTSQTPSGDADAGAGDLSVLAGRGVLNIAGGVGNGIFIFLWVVVVSRGLGAEGAGELFVASGLFTILTSAVLLGSDVGLVRSLSGTRAQGRNNELRRYVVAALFPVLVGAIAVGGVVFAHAGRIARALTDENATTVQTYIRLFAPFLPLAAMHMAALAGTNGLGRMLPTVLLEKIGRVAAQTFLVAGVLSAGLGVFWIAMAWALPFGIGALIGLLWLAAILRRATSQDHSEGARPLRQVAGEFWRFAAARGLAQVSQVSVLWLNTLLLAALMDARAAGIFTASSRFSLVGSLVLLAVIHALAPQIGALFARGELRRVEHVYQAGTWWLMSITWPAFLAMAAFAPVLLRIYGPQFQIGQGVVTIISLTMLISMAAGPVDTVLLMSGKSGWNLFNTLAALAANVTLNLLLIPRYGLLGAAASFACGVAINNIAPLLEVRFLLGLNPFGRGWLVPAVASLGCFGIGGIVVRLAWGESVLVAGVYLVAATLIYAAVIWRFRRVLHLHEIASVLRSRTRTVEMTSAAGP